jgi:hypothetical protein
MGRLWYQSYTNEPDNNEYAIESRKQACESIKTFMANNCTLLMYYGLSVQEQCKQIGEHTKVKLNMFNLSRLKHGETQTCSIRLLMYVASFWGLSFPVMFSKEFDVMQVSTLVVFPPYVTLPVKNGKRVNNYPKNRKSRVKSV